jgi:hypothetical protein
MNMGRVNVGWAPCERHLSPFVGFRAPGPRLVVLPAADFERVSGRAEGASSPHGAGVTAARPHIWLLLIKNEIKQ